MKVIKVTDQAIKQKREKRKSGNVLNISAILTMMAISCAMGLYIGFNMSTASEVKADTVEVHEVTGGETIWDIALPVAEHRNEDIREVMYQLMADNGIAENAEIHPGQKIIIR